MKLRSSELNGVTGITADSRAVRPGFLFAALPGVQADGRRFIPEAVAQGAAAVLAPVGTAWPDGVPALPFFQVENPRARLAELAVELAGPMPARLAAVTGTNGKTSTVDFLRQILTLDGRKAASMGTLGVIADGVPPGDSLTTPDPVSLANTLAMLAAQGFADVALEASSHGLDQYRLDGLRFQVAGFTNLTRDHLDYHGSMAAYGAAKLGLFERLLAPGAALVAMADLAPEILARLRQIMQQRGQGLTEVRIDKTEAHPGGQIVFANGCEYALELPGRFQADNAMLAAAMAYAFGVTDAFTYLPRLMGVRGRLERALVLPNGAAAYVDYAHTPDAISRLLSALRPHATGRLVIVFGAGGDRDAGKRPLMGAAAAGADAVIVTDDNPRSENPALIRAAILAACPSALEIGDRRAAIAAGLDMLRAGDVLVVAGKGHEQGQIVAGAVLPFDDASVIREIGA
jgi:UDP-N-acetylmuramoyl-L-alanyl-D-glutamate--2,6-diaminopimelate ligase